MKSTCYSATLDGMHPFVPDIRNWCHKERYVIAGSEAVSPNALVTLSDDTSSKVRQHVAENPKCPVAILERLADDSDWEVRVAVAENPNAPLPVVVSIAHDENSDVRYALAENHQTPQLVLETLAADDNPYIASRAAKTLAMIATLVLSLAA